MLAFAEFMAESFHSHTNLVWDHPRRSLSVFEVAAVDGAVIQEALQLNFSDFEDALTAAAARLAGCASIVTRDPKGFRGSPVRALTPEAVIPLL